MKNKTNVIRLLSFFVFLSVIGFVSCQKEASKGTQSQNEQFAQAASASDAESEAMFDDVFDNVIGVNTEVGIGGTGVFAQPAPQAPGEEIISGANHIDSVPPCLTVTVTRLNDPATFPVKIVLDFGAGCTGRDGLTRKGKIITVYTGRLLNPGAVAETSFDGYYVNDVHVEGTHRAENKSTSSNLIFGITVANAKLSKPNGDYSEWNSNKTITQVDGNATPFNPLDDVFAVAGEGNGDVKKDTMLYRWAVRTLPDNPLVKKFVCRWIVKGKLAYRQSTADADLAVLDFGNGVCDNKATLTIGGAVYEISLN